MAYTYCCVYSARLLMMDIEAVPKHVEFYSKNKFEKLVHLVGFITRILMVTLCTNRINLTQIYIMRRVHFRRVCKIAKSDYQLRHVCPTVLSSVCLSAWKKLVSYWMEFNEI